MIVNRNEMKPLDYVEDRVVFTLKLLCIGVEVEKMLETDRRFLLPISERINLLRDTNRIGSSLMSDKERLYLWNLIMVLSTKYGPIGLEVYDIVRSFITFNGIFMGPGYSIGYESIWRYGDTD